MRIKCTDFYGKTHFVDSADLIDRRSAYGVYIVHNTILLIQDPRSQRWELPGGGLEEGETPQDCIVREFSEETGTEPIGSFTLLKEWTEYFFDVVSGQAWKSMRQFYLVSNINQQRNLLTTGNGEDSAIAKHVPLGEIGNLHIAPTIREVIGLARHKAQNSKNTSKA